MVFSTIGDCPIVPPPRISDNDRMNQDPWREEAPSILPRITRSRIFWIALQLAVSVCFVIAATRMIDFGILRRTLAGIRFQPLLLAVGIHFFLIWVNALKVKVLLRGDSPPLGRLFRLNLMKIFFNNSLPGGMAGDVARVFYLGREIGSWEKSAAAVFFDRITSQSAMAFFILAALIARQKPGVHWTANLALVCAGAAFIGVLVHSVVMILGRMNFRYLESFRILDRIRMKINGAEFRKFFLGLAWNWRILLQVAAICLVSQTIWILRLAFIVWSMGASVDLTILPIALGFGSLLSLLPISLGGIGLNEGAFALIFGMAGASKELGLGVAAVQRLTSVLPAVLGWLQYVRGFRPAAPRVPSSAAETAAPRAAAGRLAGSSLRTTPSVEKA